MANSGARLLRNRHYSERPAEVTRRMYLLTRLCDEKQTQNVKGHLKVSRREASLREQVPHGGSGATGLQRRRDVCPPLTARGGGEDRSGVGTSVGVVRWPLSSL